MRKPQYMSPTSLRVFESAPEEYYLNYLADARPPRMAQTQPMSVGSAFDAYVKSYLHENLFGVVEPEYELKTIFESQVEPQNRTWAWEAGANCFKQYKEMGALANLMLELSFALHDPRFEFTVESNVSHSTRKDDVPILGKPDIYFFTEAGHVILDWKVNGYCSKASPKQGYVRILPSGKMHKSCQPQRMGGIDVNIACYLEAIDRGWADQLTSYGWVLGEDVGNKIIIGIDQLACDSSKIRVASHRGRVSADYQIQLFQRYADAWAVINSNHFFREMSFEESAERCAVLDQYHKAYTDDGTPYEEWFKQMTR